MGHGTDVGLGIVGCGDVLGRSYLPGIRASKRATILALCDADRIRAESAASTIADWSPGAEVHTTLEDLLSCPGLDAVLNLTPPSAHATVSRAALDAGLHVFSEKPLASDVRDAESLLATAERRKRRLLCAPAISASPRFRWIGDLLRASVLGRPTLACAQFANLGPAALKGYTGDPSVHYGPQVGPLVDQGVYLLHALTGLLGPARAVTANTVLALSTRDVTHGRLRGKKIAVTSPDHALLQVAFEGGAIAQILSSFAVHATKAPALEIHCTRGSLSLDDLQDVHAQTNVFLGDGDGLGLSGWLRDVGPDGHHCPRDLIALGPIHFLSVLCEGQESPLDGSYACHVLAIIEAARASANSGTTVQLSGAA